MNWKRFFRDYGRDLLATDDGGTVRVEDLYQAFKARLIAELGVLTWDMSGPHRSGSLFERETTGDSDGR